MLRGTSRAESPEHTDSGTRCQVYRGRGGERMLTSVRISTDATRSVRRTCVGTALSAPE